MKIERKDHDELTAELNIKIEESDYKEQVEKSLKNYRKQAQMPGFRAGMVPMGMIRKMVGTNVLLEEVNRLLSENLHKHIVDEQLNILGNPLPKEDVEQKNDWENQKDFEFSFEIGLAPEINVSLSEKDKFDKYKIKVTEQMVDEQIEDIAKHFGKMINAEEVTTDSILTGTFKELEKGSLREDGISNQTTLSLKKIKKEGDRKKFYGKKVGDTIKLKPQNLVDAKQASEWLGIEEQYIQDQKSEFQFQIEVIQRIEPGELNAELFDKIYGEGQVESLEEMKTKVREDLEKTFEENSNQLFVREVQDYLLKKAKLKLPDEFMKKWLQANSEKEVTKEEIEEEYEQYALGLKWQLIENKLLKDNQIQITEEELKEYTIDYVNRQLASMGHSGMSLGELDATANQLLSDQEQAGRIQDDLTQQKLNKFYLDTVKIKSREISYDDFRKLAEKKNK